jgi:predicted pyridoxine 5'-phosphate oxidase superfamily flavin-nucleotide-binding protein
MADAHRGVAALHPYAADASMSTRTPDQPFHAGERAVQGRVDARVRERWESAPPRGIRDAMPDQHRELFGKLPWLIVGSVDDQLQPWASVLVGAPGFIATPDATTLHIAAQPFAGDPLAEHLQVGAPLGLLGIALETRRRNRVNGVISDASSADIRVHVGQSFGNCNQYIHAREPHFADASEQRAADSPLPLGAALSEAALALIARSDTLFIASATQPARGSDAAVHGADVSHRGGPAGFVRSELRDGRIVLSLPDYRGNNFFNTFGNLALWPHAGLLFIDFATGDLLSVVGHTEVIWDGAEVASIRGAERLLHVYVERGVWLAGALPLRWSQPQPAREFAGW